MFGELGTEFTKILIWYLVFLVLGIATLPFLQKYFSTWKDKGYGISKFVGLAVVSLPLWFLSNLRVLPFTQTTALVFFFGFAGLAFWWGRKTKFKFDKKLLKWIITEELIFLLIFIFWTFVRSTNSQVEGTEKMMNIAFMNSIFRTEYFPAADPWYYGGTINYYHLGHYMFTFIAKMASIPVSFAYNFALNTIAGFTFIASFSIVIKLIDAKKNTRGAVFAGLFSGLLLCFGSNMHYIYKWLEAILNNKAFTYWFPDGTRIITNVIDEFPAYSIPLGDLHGHYLGMPFLVIMIAFVVISYTIKIGTKDKMRFNMLISIFVCTLYGINSWDFITTIFIFSLLHFHQSYTSYKNWGDRIMIFVVSEISLLGIGIIFMIPYIVNFHPPIGGIGIVPLGQTSDFLPWMQMWGNFVFITGAFFLMKSFTKHWPVIRVLSITALGCVLLLPLLGNMKSLVTISDGLHISLASNFSSNIMSWVIGLVSLVIFVAFFSVLFKYIKIKLDYQSSKYETLVFLLLFVCAALLIGVEVFFVKDIFYHSNPPYFRTNTVFKFFYHTWIIWSILCGYFVYKIFSTFLNNKTISARVVGAALALVILTLFTVAVSYTFEAIKDFYPFFKYDNSTYPTLQQLFSSDAGIHIKIYDSIDGNMYIKKNHPGDYAAMQWFNENVQGQPTIVEAVGDAYTYYARFSANLGLVDIMGWPTHEWQWRSNPVAVVNKSTGEITYNDSASTDAFARKDDVKTIYTTASLDTLKGMLVKYKVRYIIIGELENEAYAGIINESLISQVSTKVYDNLGTKIYQVTLSY